MYKCPSCEVDLEPCVGALGKCPDCEEIWPDSTEPYYNPKRKKKKKKMMRMRELLIICIVSFITVIVTNYYVPKEIVIQLPPSYFEILQENEKRGNIIRGLIIENQECLKRDI